MRIKCRIEPDESRWWDWGPLNAQLAALKKGELMVLQKPGWMPMKHLRTQLLNQSKKYHGPAGLRLRTRSEGYKLECKLVEKSS